MILTRDKPALAPVRPSIPAGRQTFVAVVPDATAFVYRLGLLEKVAEAVCDGKAPPPAVVAELRKMTRTGESR